MKIIIATGNKNKVREFKEMLPEYEMDICSSKAEETGSTFMENALIKAEAVKKLPGMEECVVIADDSGICIDAMDGGPGIYSSRFMGEDTSYDIKNRAILDKLEGLGDDKRGAHYTCAVCAILPDGRVISHEGIMEGRIAYAPAGTNGFGYDPIFFLPEYGKTSAQISPEEKNAISHRGKALRAVIKSLKEELPKYTR